VPSVFYGKITKRLKRGRSARESDSQALPAATTRAFGEQVPLRKGGVLSAGASASS